MKHYVILCLMNLGFRAARTIQIAWAAYHERLIKREQEKRKKEQEEKCAVLLTSVFKGFVCRRR